MKKLLPFLLTLVLIACDKGDDSTADPSDTDAESGCQITEEKYSGGYSPHYIYTYDATGKPAEAEKIVEGEIKSRWKYEYDNKGNIVKLVAYGINGGINSTYQYKYDAQNLLIESIIYSYTEKVAHLVYEYTSLTQLKKVTSIPTSSQYEEYYYTYEYKDGLMYKIHSYSKGGELMGTTQYEYDNKKNPVLANKFLSLFNPLLTGFPFKHNINKVTSTSFDGGSDYSITYDYVYNEKGYPISGVITESNGHITNFTYTYQCK